MVWKTTQQLKRTVVNWKPFSNVQRPGMLGDAQRWLPTPPASKKNTGKGEDDHTGISSTNLEIMNQI